MNTPRALIHAGTACMLLVISTAVHAAEWNVDQLMQQLAQVRANRATFVEKKYLAILDKPVESSGELFYTAPDRLEKRTHKPKPESMILEQGVLIVERGRQKHRLMLTDYPELGAFIDSIRGTLAGDRTALERSFRLSLTGNAEQWTLVLTPLSEKMQTVVKHIRIGGMRDRMRSIETAQADGDRSLMIIDRHSTP